MSTCDGWKSFCLTGCVQVCNGRKSSNITASKEAMPASKPQHLNSKYDPEYHPETAYQLTLLGITGLKIAQLFGITEKTFENWKSDHPEVFQSIREAKELADANIAKSLYQRAQGYSHPETKAQWVSTDVKIDGEWRRQGRWEYAEMIRHYPPDPTSMIFWLKNRHSRLWSDKQRVEVGIDPDMLDTFLAALPEGEIRLAVIAALTGQESQAKIEDN